MPPFLIIQWFAYGQTGMATVMVAFFATFYSNAQKSLRRVAIFLVKVMKTPVIGLKTLHNIPDVCCFCLPNTKLQLPNYSTRILVFKIPKTSADQSNKLEILSLIPFVHHKVYLPSSGL